MMMNHCLLLALDRHHLRVNRVCTISDRQLNLILRVVVVEFRTFSDLNRSAKENGSDSDPDFDPQNYYTAGEKRYVLPSWAEFDLGRAPVYWKTMNGLPPSSGEKLKLFYNPAASKLVPNEDYEVAFNGGFNQPIMCGGEPRAMLQKVRGKADPPIYTIQILVPKHALSLIFSITNGSEWDGPYRLQFQVPKAWKNRPLDFFTELKLVDLDIG